MNQLVNNTFSRLIEDLDYSNYQIFLSNLRDMLAAHYQRIEADETDKKYIVKWQTAIIHPPNSSKYTWKDCYARKNSAFDIFGRLNYSTVYDRNLAELMTKEEAEQYIRDLEKTTYDSDAKIEEY